jgi:hypothetical protein
VAVYFSLDIHGDGMIDLASVAIARAAAAASLFAIMDDAVAAIVATPEAALAAQSDGDGDAGGRCSRCGDLELELAACRREIGHLRAELAARPKDNVDRTQLQMAYRTIEHLQRQLGLQSPSTAPASPGRFDARRADGHEAISKQTAHYESDRLRRAVFETGLRRV